MKLFLNGKEFKSTREIPTVLQAKKFLGASKDGELFVKAQVAVAIKVNPKTLDYAVTSMPEYVTPGGHGRTRYWGKPATIRALRKQLAKEAK